MALHAALAYTAHITPSLPPTSLVTKAVRLHLHAALSASDEVFRHFETVSSADTGFVVLPSTVCYRIVGTF